MLDLGAADGEILYSRRLGDRSARVPPWPSGDGSFQFPSEWYRVQSEAGSLNRQHIVAEVAPSFPQSLPTPPVRLLEREIEECRKEISLLNQRLINTILDAAIANARILPVERRHWNDALADNFDNASAQLATATPRLKMGTLTEGLRRTKLAESGEQKQRNIIALVHERMRSGGLSYHQAWMAITAERSDLF
jgi:hypothetical protein